MNEMRQLFFDWREVDPAPEVRGESSINAAPGGLEWMRRGVSDMTRSVTVGYGEISKRASLTN